MDKKEHRYMIRLPEDLNEQILRVQTEHPERNGAEITKNAAYVMLIRIGLKQWDKESGK